MGEIAALDNRIEKMKENLKEISYRLEDAASEITEYKDKVSLNPEKLREVEERLNFINNLKSKYGNTIEEIIAYRDKIYKELNAIDYDDAKVEKLREQVKSLEQIVSRLSKKLSDNRKKIARNIEKDVVKELNDLKNEKLACFEVSIIQQEDINGIGINGKNYKDRT